MTGAIDAHDQPKAPATPRLDAGQRILHHGRPARARPQTHRGLEEDRGSASRQPEMLRLDTSHAHLEEAFHASGREDFVEVLLAEMTAVRTPARRNRSSSEMPAERLDPFAMEVVEEVRDPCRCRGRHTVFIRASEASPSDNVTPRDARKLRTPSYRACRRRIGGSPRRER